ncbi:MAG: inositol monophosphatase family protein, partial [bacterium]|nr:inositol monophosphatase family protein [bacterium]
KRTGGREGIFDELDGTKWYSEGGLSAVFAGAIMVNNIVQDAIIYAPLFEMPVEYTASLGGGSFLNGKQILVSPRRHVMRIAVATAGHSAERYDAQPIIAKLLKHGYEVEDVKSISYSCAALASGVIDGILFPWGTLWDVIPGDLLVREAGGVTSDLDGAALDYSGDSVDGFIMASNDLVHKLLFMIVRENRRTPT